MKTRWTVKFNSLKTLALIAANGLAAQLASGQCVSPPPGLVSWWRAEGNALDLIGTNSGNLLNGTGFTNGMVGQAFSFNGSGQCVQVSYSPSLSTSNYSIEAWVKPAAQAVGQKLIFGQSFGRCQLIVGPGVTGLRVQFTFVVNGSTYPDFWSTTEIPIGQFSHLVGTWDGTTLRLFLNGALDAQTTPGISPTVSGCDFFIGGFYSACGYTGQFFNGIIDEIGYYNRALADGEIQALYNAGSAGKCMTPPLAIATQPQSQLGYWGKSVSFSVSATNGVPPYSYQWQKEGVSVPDATNSLLVLANLQATNAGTYTVVVSDTVTNLTSQPATLTVNPAGVSIALYAGVTIDGVVGYTYGIQSTLDLSNTNSWVGRANVTLTNATQLWYDSQPATQPQTYYRVLPGPISIP